MNSSSGRNQVKCPSTHIAELNAIIARLRSIEEAKAALDQDINRAATALWAALSAAEDALTVEQMYEILSVAYWTGRTFAKGVRGAALEMMYFDSFSPAPKTVVFHCTRCGGGWEEQIPSWKAMKGLDMTASNKALCDLCHDLGTAEHASVKARMTELRDKLQDLKDQQHQLYRYDACRRKSGSEVGHE